MTLTERREREVACCCGLELQEIGLPLELLPVAHGDACWLEGRSLSPAPELSALVATGCLAIELEVVKNVEEHLALHGKWEAKAAAALHAVMRRMRQDVKRRILDFQSTEPTTVLPVGRWWRSAMAAVNPKLVRAAMEAGKQTLRRHNQKRPRLRKKLTFDDTGDVLIDIPADAKLGMVNGIAETMGKDYWLKWEESIRAMVFDTIQSGLDQHLNLLQIADKMDDAWAFDYKRAMLVTRTEVNGAMNFGHYVVSEELVNDPESAVDGREWLSILDATTRPAHAEANGQQVVKLKNGSWVVRQDDSVIGEGRTFIVGGERARFPGDPSLSAGNRIQCRCTLVDTFGGELPEEESEEPVLAEPVEPEPVEAAIEVPTPKRPEWPTSANELEFVQDLGGSTGARLMKDQWGRKFVLKQEVGGDRLREEFTAEQMYRAAGLNVPASKLYEEGGQVRKLSRFIPNAKELGSLTGDAKAAAIAELRKGMATDAALANWDAAGLNLDNVLVDAKGKVWRADVGGSLRWRAMGQRKGDAFTEYATELWTMRDSRQSAGKVFAGMGHDEVVASAESLLKRRKKVLDAITDLDLRAKMEKRLDSIQEFAATSKLLKDDKWKEAFRDDFTRHQMQMDQSGVFARFPKMLKKSGKYEVVDENGLKWDHLRGTDSSVRALSNYMTSHGGDYKAISHYLRDQAGSSWRTGACALKHHLLQSKDVDLSAFYFKVGNPEQYLSSEWKTFASHYPNEDVVRQSFIMQHVYMRNFCKRVDFDNNNLQRGVVTLGRAMRGGIVKRELGVPQVVRQGPAESYSLHVQSNFGPDYIVQEVPHHRIFGHYYHEGTPGIGDTPFLSDSENEVIAMTEGIESRYAGFTKEGKAVKMPKKRVVR